MFYPDNARYAKLAAAELGLDFTDLDRGNGYLFAISGNGRRMLSGAGTVCSFPINNASSYSIARDKAHTKSVLSHQNIRSIPGRHFFVSDEYSKLRNAGHDAADAIAFAEECGFPLFCKPLRGGRGNLAEPVCSPGDLLDYMQRLSRHYDGFLIEPLVHGDEYRVIVHSDRAVCYSRKRETSIRGDGYSTAEQLLGQINASLTGSGISPYPASSLTLSGLQPTDVPGAGDITLLAGRRNLSAFGEIEAFETAVPPELESLAADSCRAVGLRLGAVDLFDISTGHDLAELMIIEVNGNPGLTTLERSGRLDLIVELWKSMIAELLEL